jgi:putative glutamine transport system substrate-binding protein
VLAGCSNQLTPAKIAKEKTMTIGVKTDVPGFSYLSPKTGEYSGMEIDLGNMIAKEFGAKAVFEPVTTVTRKKMLETDYLDAVIATYTITDGRKEKVGFTRPYFTGSLGFLVMNDAPYQKIEDLKGKKVGVVYGATASKELPKFSKAEGLDLTEVELIDYASVRYQLARPESDLDAFSADRIILNGYDDEKTRILEGGYAPQEYGIAVKKENTKLCDAIDKLLEKWEKDGTLEKLYKKYNLTDFEVQK